MASVDILALSTPSDKVATPITPSVDITMSHVRRKRPPSFPTMDPRYPAFDPQDPFAPLSDLRRRSQSLALGDASPSGMPTFNSNTCSDSVQHSFALAPGHPRQPGCSLLRFYKLSVPGTANGESTTRRFSSIQTLDDVHIMARKEFESDQYQHHKASHRHSVASLFDATHSATTINPKFHIRGYQPRKSSRLTRTCTPPLTDNSASSSGTDSEDTPSPSQSPSVVMAPLPQGSSISVGPSESKVAQMPTPTSRTSSSLTLGRGSMRKDPPEYTYTFPAVTGSDVPRLPFPRPLSSLMVPGATESRSSSDSAGEALSSRSPSPPDYADELQEGMYSIQPDIIHETPALSIGAGIEPPPRRRSRVFSFSSLSFLRSRVDLLEMQKEARRSFDEHALPTPQQLTLAASLPLITESGVRVRFGDLWQDSRTIVIFIRHFWCTACQDYMRSIASDVDLVALESVGIKLVVVGLGSSGLIAPYNELTGNRVPLYTDPSMAIHRALGMTLKSTNPGPESQRGEYIKHSVMGGVGKMMMNLVTGKMPIFERDGDAQLGGEFVIGPGLKCTYAHRMTNTRSHASILNVISAAGVDPKSLHEGPRRSWRSEDEEDVWMEKRRLSWARIRERRQSRRVGDAGFVLDISRDRFIAAEEGDSLDGDSKEILHDGGQ